MSSDVARLDESRPGVPVSTSGVGPSVVLLKVTLPIFGPHMYPVISPVGSTDLLETPADELQGRGNCLQKK